MSKMFDVVYEDESLLVINKQVGVVVQHGVGNEDNTLVDFLIKENPSLKEVGVDGELRAGIVHRLDKGTSGVMLIAKKQEMFLYLTKLFKERKVKKEYKAFVFGVVKRDRGTISRAIKRSRGDFRKKAVVHGNEVGKDAITEYVVKKRGENITYLSLYPLTGRTHQLRVHMRSIGHPILCDQTYSNGKSNDIGLNRLGLHSHVLTLMIPDKKGAKEEKEFIAPLPKDFEEAIKKI